MASSPKFPTSVPLGTDGVPTDFNRNIYCNLKLPLGLENEDYPRESCEFPLERLPPFKDEYPGTCHRRRRCKSEGVDSERSQLHSRVMQNEMKKRSKIVDGHDLKPRRGHQCTNTEDLNCYQKNSRCLDVKRMNSLLSPYNGFYDNHNNQINPLSTITFKQLNELSGNQNHTRSREKYLNIWNQELSREFFCRSSSMNKSLENSCFGKSVSQSKTSSQSHFSHTGNSLYDELLLKDMKIQELYKKEMEVLRCKLNELQGGDAKRMRKQNECDLLGNSFGLTSCSVAAVEIKRPRDNSPVYYQFRAVLPPYPNDECLSSCSLRDDGRRRLHEEEPCNTATMMIHFENESLRSIPSEHRPITNVLCPLDDSKRNGSQTNRIVNNIITNCSKKSKSDFCDFQSQTVPLKRQCKSTKFEEFSSPSTDSGSVISQCDEEEMRNISTHVKINSHLELRVNDLTDVINDSASTTVICSTNVPNPMCSSASSFIDIATNSDEPLCQPHPALRVSLFTNVPPYINFSTHSEKGVPLPANVQKLLKWKLSSITPVVVRHTILNSGFKLVRKSNEWTGTWGKHMKSICFKTLKDYQKMNHFPGSFQIGRKDRLWKNLSRLMTKFGKKEFGFTPRTFVLPQDTKLLRSAWEKNCGKEKWIIKPPASARGTGIKVIAKWGHIPRKVPLVVQKYIEKPYLINSTKFDLRLYVLVTSMNPLKIYMYDNGLVRFASVKYSSDPATLGERYMHLTNYSINKESSQYTQNQDADSCEGHKWTLKTLWSYLEREHKVPVNALWTSLVDVVIKTLICGESSISQLTQANLPSRYCAYELFGIDILFDHLLKPWLLEVNISPSLHSSSPLDLAVKGPLVRDLMNIIGFQIPPKLSGTLLAEAKKNLGIKSNLCYDKRLFTALISNAEREKQMAFLSMESREDYLDSILEDLTPDDVRHLVIYEDELTQLGSFQKVFPTPKTHEYHNFFEAPRYYNKLFDAWEVRYHKNRSKGIELLESKCKQKIHLDVSQINFNTTKGLGKRRKLGLIRNFNFSWKSQGKIPRCFIKNVKKSGENQKKIVSCTTNGSLPDQDKTHPSKEEKSTEVVNQSETVAVGSKISS